MTCDPAEASGCPVPMYRGERCGRAPYRQSAWEGHPAVCLMHSKNPTKPNEAFQEEIDRILAQAGVGEADFSGFVFPQADYSSRTFSPTCIFTGATFLSEARFSRFEREVDFCDVTFCQVADLSQATFQGPTWFLNARFSEAAFWNASFGNVAHFEGSTFSGAADFNLCAFSGMTEFDKAVFENGASFFRASFGMVPSGRYSYERSPPSERRNSTPPLSPEASPQAGATAPLPIMPPANWTTGTLPPDKYVADFKDVTFVKKATFEWAQFKVHEVDFSRTTFGQEGADFSYSEFPGRVDFSARFLGPVRFWKTKFREDSEPSPGPIFSSSEFTEPESVFFYQTHLGQALFHNCDVSKVRFSSVRWRRRRRSDRNMVFEEVVRPFGSSELDPAEDEVREAVLHAGTPEGTRRPPGTDILRARERNERNYRLITELYQQLKSNYDEHGDHWTAGDFHYGEMEMKRLFSRNRYPALRWLHRHLGLVAWYRYVSEYGQNYRRPALWLAAALLGFALIYPLTGLTHCVDERGRSAACRSERGKTLTPVTVSYFDPLPRRNAPISEKATAWPRLIGHGLMTTLEIATLEKQLDYEPDYPLGRLLMAFQVLLTATLLALFVLALRRQFKR